MDGAFGTHRKQEKCIEGIFFGGGGESEGKRQLGRPALRWESKKTKNIQKMG
jgi:hypothetical protein